MSLPAGVLQELVVVESPTETRNSLGETTLEWTQFGRAWASIEAVSYSEQELRRETVGMATHTVRMRYMPGLTGKMRLRWASRSNRLLWISSVVEKGRREEHELACEERVT
jgi:SPP1 family predicted phage head-tail adaptor